ncbi:OmpA family protein [Ferruginibacter lapsinanis]|uniref:OmpA family protein n=1 Tax=Ferruginibacter lapsinanis TaxID=563172 RepID=UPI001E3E92BA|nr:OmpA family protein [Ferruginibacter lapsinanis]UEG51142.1 OmpA family protein [Ferruginibacter lapsinanis]
MKYLFSTILFSALFFVASAQDYIIEGNEVKIDKPILFKTASATLLPESDEALTVIKNYLEAKTYISLLRVEGHTNSAGDESAAQYLSEQRAKAVCKRLVELGVDCKRLLAVGFGSQKPIADNSTPEGRAANTRISFMNAAIRGHLIGGMPGDGGGVVAGDVCE